MRFQTPRRQHVEIQPVADVEDFTGIDAHLGHDAFKVCPFRFRHAPDSADDPTRSSGNPILGDLVGRSAGWFPVTPSR